MKEVFRRAECFIYRNARPLDLARWRYHFKEGTQEDVLNALRFYQNADGGFGHALEPDAWNPQSTPIQTWAATEILREIRFIDAAYPLIQEILAYLGSGQHFYNNRWDNVVMSNNAHPHAPWWHRQSDAPLSADYNPTACLAGFILRFATPDSEIYPLGASIAQEAFAAYMATDYWEDMHTVSCYIRLWEYCRAAKVEIIDLDGLQKKLMAQISHNIIRDKTRWLDSYVCKPSFFFKGPESPFYDACREMAHYEWEYIQAAQLEDGSWPIPWSWKEYPKQWAISENWWKSHGIIENLLYLKGFGKL